MWKYFRSGRSELTQFFYSRETCAIWRQTWRLILLANRVTNFAHARYKLNGCRQRQRLRHASSHSENVAPADNRQELQPQNESVIHQPIPLVPFHRELWGIWSRFRRAGRRGVNLLILHTRARHLPRPGTTLWPWFVTRLISIPHVESVWVYGNVNLRSSLHECEWYARMYTYQVCDIFMNMVWNTSLVYYDSKWINKTVYQKLARYQMQRDKMAILI